VRWRAYPLNPYAPGASLFGFAPDSAYDRASITQKTTKSRPAQELTKWAESLGKGEVFRNAVWQAKYVDGKDISNTGLLIDLADSIGLSREEAASVLKHARFKEAVDADWVRSLEVDPQYVPSVLLNLELLENPQEYKMFEELMARHDVKRNHVTY
jgi:predicted DsbA family dithiol-disulfide isomerase